MNFFEVVGSAFKNLAESSTSAVRALIFGRTEEQKQSTQEAIDRWRASKQYNPDKSVMEVLEGSAKTVSGLASLNYYQMQQNYMATGDPNKPAEINPKATTNMAGMIGIGLIIVTLLTVFRR